MKNIITICSILFFSFFTLAQEKENIAKEEWQNPNWKVLLSKLDTTQIKSGVLIDKVTSFANLLFFNTEKHNISDKDHYIQALSEVHRASLDSKNTMPYEVVEDLRHKNDNVLNISYINTSVDYIDSS